MQNVLRRLQNDAKKRKDIPITTGVLDYFPLAVAEVAKVSKAGNDQHNPGQPLHWDRGKSSDHADCVVRHLVERGTVDSDGMRHSAKMAWRALALLQEEMEAEAGFDPNAGQIGATHDSIPPGHLYCTRHPYHGGPCNGLPMGTCPGYQGAKP